MLERTSGKNSESETDREERLASVLDEVLHGGTEASSDARLSMAVRQHPDLAADLRELWATAMIANDVAMFQSAEVSRIIDGTGSGPLKTPDWSLSGGNAAGAQIGNYELQEEIGRGGMGVVYRAYQRDLKRSVALKMIPNAAFASSQDLARLRAEAIAAASLAHPNIVPVYDVGEYNGQPWFSMQLIEGHTLSQLLARGPISSRDAVSILLPVVDAIGTAHRAGLLHRDLKPSNILIAEGGVPFVTDFGLAKRVHSADGSADLSHHSIRSGMMTAGSAMSGLTQTGAILGTPAWMSPEQAAGQVESIDVTTDIYSLGAILYAMLTGRPPFQAASPLDTLLMVMEQDPPSIRLLNPAIDSDLAMVVLKCLQKPRDLRYSSTDQLAADLKAWLNSEPVSARQSTVMQVMTRLFRESHQAAILENWGLLWMWHSLVLVLLCFITNAFQLWGVDHRTPYVALWVVGLGLWAAIFWNLRHRAGPITAIERQIAHVWAGSMIASTMLFAVEWIMDRSVLELSPVLGTIAGIVFLVKAGMLSGSFYIQAALLFATSPLMAAMQQSNLPNFSIALFGLISGSTFFFPGLKYYRQQQRTARGRRSLK